MPALNELDPYFALIDAPDAIRARTRVLLDYHRTVWGKAPDHVLLENIATPEGVILFTGLACLAGKTYADLPIPEPNWTPSILSISAIRSIQFTVVHDFDFKNPLPTSKLSANVRATDTAAIALNAVGKNCGALMNFIRDHLVPRVG